MFLGASVSFVWRPQVLECLDLICHLSPFILTRSCFQLLRGRVLGRGVMLTRCGKAEGGAGGDLFTLCMDRRVLCSSGAIGGLQGIVTGSLQPSGMRSLQDFPVLLSASVLLSPGLFISVGAVAINRMIKKSHPSESMR